MSFVLIDNNAIKKIKNIISENDIDLNNTFLRIGFRDSLYYFQFDNVFTNQDFRSEQEGITILLNKKDLPYLNGLEISYQKELNENGFIFRNSNSFKNVILSRHNNN